MRRRSPSASPRVVRAAAAGPVLLHRSGSVNGLRRPALALALAAASAIASLAPAPANAASETEMAELVRLMRATRPDGGVVVAAGHGSAEREPTILATLARGDDGETVLTVAFQSRVGLVAVGDSGDTGPGACDVVLQDTNGDGVADVAEFHCDRASAEMPKALALLRQPLFDGAVRALIRRLATV